MGAEACGMGGSGGGGGGRGNYIGVWRDEEKGGREGVRGWDLVLVVEGGTCRKMQQKKF